MKILFLTLLILLSLHYLNYEYRVRPATEYALSLPSIQYVTGCQNDIFNHDTGELIYRPPLGVNNGNCLTVPNPWLPQNIITHTAWEQVRVEGFGYKVISLMIILIWLVAAWPVWLPVVITFMWFNERIDKSPVP
ncbi:hypothetical protein A2954_02135 [Candidatus Roizmanbacteria bacterium RIFCSPLOWO2_01_FULL_37_12]|uniref:Uncharacterized protein n=2 Tax=Microgenomates group TaxID=1794810 RepID=A0A1F7IB33_9BACT|nr:MAG: hypothetical protein A2777_03755 [Candidatus Gottesmanbacteria bacterium RIFCSPHIGHO2_01_FULL_40_15]OGK40550.1 MAG: hypothetical protein A2954_02135 [Candidatus Roizmanbacteria bacterium RIFCSPLOWO2_01_FULL_37_12]